MSIRIENFVNDAKSRGLTEHTIATYKSEIAVFLNFVGNPLSVDIPILVKFLDYLKIMEYKRGRRVLHGVNPKTLRAYFSAINQYYEFLIFTKQIAANPVPSFIKRYLSRIKQQYNSDNSFQVISFDDMRKLVNLDMPILDRAILFTLAKTGVRRGELIAMDREDVNLDKREIILKPKAKRTNRLVLFDEEAELVLRAYLEWRDKDTKSNALFVYHSIFYWSDALIRVNKDYINEIVARHGEKLGLHNANASLNQKLTPHCFRHWFTTQLRRGGMPREFIKELRGDCLKDAFDIYNHIDLSELKESYLKCIHKLFNGCSDERVTVSPVGVKDKTEWVKDKIKGVKVKTEEVKVKIEGVKIKQDLRGKHKHNISGFSLTLYEFIQNRQGMSTASISKSFLKNKDYVKRYLYNLKNYGYIVNYEGNWFLTSKKPF